MKWVGAIFLFLGILIIYAVVYRGYTIIPTSTSGVNAFPPPQFVSFGIGAVLILIGVAWIFKR